MRAERREARRQILSDLRNSSAAEKQSIRQNVTETRNERNRIEGERAEKVQPREREKTPEKEWNTPHIMPPPPPHWWGNPRQSPGWGDLSH
ncbi:hypothetical protein BGX12_12612 [Fibrobacter sp. UWR4]|nr:hypothetical protein BGX12_12612 [Fibrobacter sp. UWR4]